MHPLTEKDVKLVVTRHGIRPTDYLANVEAFATRNPFFYDQTKTFWFWNKTEKNYQRVDETDIMNMLEDQLSFAYRGQTVEVNIKKNYLEAFRRVGRKHIPKTASDDKIQFLDGVFDIKTKELTEPTPKEWIPNIIPWKLGKSSETPTIDSLIKSWVGEKLLLTAKQIIAYSMYRIFLIHVIIHLVGNGNNGKTVFARLMQKLLGKQNYTSTELERLTSDRFEIAKLENKLAVFLPETDFGVIKKSSVIKDSTGQDTISIRNLYKESKDVVLYCLWIVNSNELPITADKSDGFFRRQLILPFNNRFPRGKDILKTVPDEEFNNLSKWCVENLPKLIETGQFDVMPSIEQQREAYENASNPLRAFIPKYCDIDPDYEVFYSEAFVAYNKHLGDLGRRKITKRKFTILLDDLGYSTEIMNIKIQKNEKEVWTRKNMIFGFRFKENLEELMKNQAKLDDF